MSILAFNRNDLFSSYAATHERQKWPAQEPWASITIVAHHLLPESDKEKRMQASLCFQSEYYNHPNTAERDRVFVLKGFGWLNELAMNTYQCDFKDGSFMQRELLIDQLAEQPAGERWLAMIVDVMIDLMAKCPDKDLPLEQGCCEVSVLPIMCEDKQKQDFCYA